ncbi:hypothetical protein ES332_D11G413800v1 [Gossypium tomentosum]|uniref:Uncharacterized protein n=1 Tax=Gossypium tomentosum TaxID=34277 RepID=A0A5D2IZF0_GOSTO|nr:hypothetical protein ES332_D11G413800v1 [Gossypium tomentosum]
MNHSSRKEGWGSFPNSVSSYSMADPIRSLSTNCNSLIISLSFIRSLGCSLEQATPILSSSFKLSCIWSFLMSTRMQMSSLLISSSSSSSPLLPATNNGLQFGIIFQAMLS